MGYLKEAPFTKEQLATDPILQYFSYSHLPERLQDVSKAFHILAKAVVEKLPRNPERTVALRKLLEAKDAAVRANIPPPKPVDEPLQLGEADIYRDGPPKFES